MKKKKERKILDKLSKGWWPEKAYLNGEVVTLNGIPGKMTEIKRGGFVEGKLLKAKFKPTEIEIEFNEEITITGIKIKIK